MYMYIYAMPRHAKAEPKDLSYTFRLSQSVRDLLEQVKQRDGVPVSEQIHRALAMWFELKGVKAKTKR
jgi:hypothetical protein